MTRPALALLLAPALLTGCVAYENDQPAFADGELFGAARPAPNAPTYTQPDAPSLTGLDRSKWERTNVNVAQRESVHQPTYRSEPVQFAKSSEVQRGEYPTHDRAGESVTGDSAGAQSLEAVVLPLQAVADMLLMIPRAIFQSPLAPVRGPLEPVDRVPPGKAYPLTGPAAATPAAPTAIPAVPAASVPPPAPPAPPAQPAQAEPAPAPEQPK